MSSAWTRFREDLGWRLRKWRESWERLPAFTRGAVATALVVVSVGSLSVAGYFTLRGMGETSASKAQGEVVLYTSTDSFLLQPVLAAFEQDTGVKVSVVTDTEATKTTGLVERLIAEKKSPRADVWWSNEPLGSVVLAQQGVLEPFIPRAAADFRDGWPERCRDAQNRWFGDCLRARVIAFNTNRFVKVNVPTKLRDLTRPEFRGRVGMARPQFGTTRLFIASLLAGNEESAVREWLDKMVANDLRLYDGNSSVVRALSNGEIDLGLTDSDDVFSAKRNTWPVDFVLEAVDKPTAFVAPGALRSAGPLLIPSTVGVVKGRPHPNEAQRLASFLLGAKVERMMAESDARTVPLRAELAKAMKGLPELTSEAPTPGQVERSLSGADALIAQYFPLK